MLFACIREVVDFVLSRIGEFEGKILTRFLGTGFVASFLWFTLLWISTLAVLGVLGGAVCYAWTKWIEPGKSQFELPSRRLRRLRLRPVGKSARKVQMPLIANERIGKEQLPLFQQEENRSSADFQAK
jgi:hypothetical protein